MGKKSFKLSDKIWNGINFHCFGEDDCPLHDAFLVSDVVKKVKELDDRVIWAECMVDSSWEDRFEELKNSIDELFGDLIK